METNYFKNLSLVKCEVEKKNWLNYISWSDAWAEVKNLHPEATYRKIMNELDNTFLFKSGTGGMVMCEVTINGISHVADLAITDFKNQEIKYDAIKSTDIQNTTQRAFAKAIAMHGIGLYVYRGEDLPDEIDWNNAPIRDDVPQIPKYTPKGKTLAEYIAEIKLEGDSNVIRTLQEEAKQGRLSEKQIAWLDKEVEARLNVLRNSPF